MYTAHLGMEELLRKGFKMWHKEQEKYTYGQDFTMETGHYTQHLIHKYMAAHFSGLVQALQ
jgi:hypothetical protein